MLAMTETVLRYRLELESIISTAYTCELQILFQVASLCQSIIINQLSFNKINGLGIELSSAPLFVPALL